MELLRLVFTEDLMHWDAFKVKIRRYTWKVQFDTPLDLTYMVDNNWNPNIAVLRSLRPVDEQGVPRPQVNYKKNINCKCTL